MKRLRRQWAQNRKKQRKKAGKVSLSKVLFKTGTAALFALYANSIPNKAVAAEPPDPHCLPVSGDTDGDFLSDQEENLLPGCSWINPDTNKNGILDGFELATECGWTIDLLPRYYDSGPISVNTTFCWPTEAYGTSETAPLLNWVRTVIEGCTTEPIVLTGFYSQTYCPLQDNETEHFLFEPPLEPGITQTQLDELKAQNIRLIHLIKGPSSSITTYGFDDESFHPADISDDGKINFRDFAMLASRWLDNICDDCGGADLTGDGTVAFEDLLELAEDWLAGYP